MKKSILLLFAAFATLAASAHDFEVNGIYYNITSRADETAEVTYKGSSHDEYSYEYSGSITIPEGVTSIGTYAFEDCSRLTSITIPEDVTSIGDYAFYGCSSLTAVHISDIAAWCNIEFFDDYSNPLCYAHNLYLNGELVTQLTLPEGVTSIGNYAFDGCYSLTTITIPEGVTSIESGAFSNCSSLTTITCKAVAPPTLENSEVFDGVNKSIPVYVPAGSIEDYKAAAYWNEFTNYADIEAGINELTGDNSQLTIYDLSGRRVEKAEKGIYIVNGKKVVIK